MSQAKAKVTKKAYTTPEKCKGCRLCIRSCPVEAISVMDMANAKGYLPVEVDMDKCIGCSMCYQVCPDTVFEIK